MNKFIVPVISTLIGVAIVLLVTTTQQSDFTRRQVESCERVNVVRSTLERFIESARDARQATGDPDVAKQYQSLLDDLEAVPYTIKDRAIVDCDRAFGR